MLTVDLEAGTEIWQYSQRADLMTAYLVIISAWYFGLTRFRISYNILFIIIITTLPVT